MSNGLAEARSLLKDVAVLGVIAIPKRKLLWLLGWAYDRPGAWQGLLDLWVELGEKREHLHAIEIYDKIVLMNCEPKRHIDPVTVWAGTKE